MVVIDTGGSVRQAVIHFDGTINGIDALRLAGANPVTYGFAGQGAAVCALDGVGNPADESCLIGPHSEYWAYFLAHGGSTGWAYSRGCACTTTVRDGDVEGWRYGTGAAPRASADFCAYADCGPPPEPPPSPTLPPAVGGGNGGSGGGSEGPTGSAGTPTGSTARGGAAGATGGAGQPNAVGSSDPAAGGASEPAADGCAGRVVDDRAHHVDVEAAPR